MRIERMAPIIVLLTLLATGISCSRDIATASAAGPPPLTAAPVPKPSTSPAASEARELVITAPILVENQVELLAQRDGVVVRIFADIGTRVHNGQLLAKLDSSQLEADRAALEHNARADAANMKYHQTEQGANLADLQRAEKMFAAGLITKEQLEHTRFLRDATVWEIDREKENEQQSEAKMRSLDLEIAKTRIVAPFAGVVGRRYVRIGQKVAPNDRLFWVTAVKPLLMRFTVPEDSLSALHKGTLLTVTTPALANERYRAQVVAVSPVVDPASGTVEVVARFSGSSGDLRPGMNATIHIPRRP